MHSNNVFQYRAFSHDVTAAILVFQNNETAAMLVYQENPLGVELFSHVNIYSKIRTRKRSAKKSIKTVKNWNPALFGIQNPVPGIRNPQRGIQNPRMSWIPLHGAKDAMVMINFITFIINILFCSLSV